MGLNETSYYSIPGILGELFELIGAREAENAISKIMDIYEGKINLHLKIQIIFDTDQMSARINASKAILN